MPYVNTASKKRAIYRDFKPTRVYCSLARTPSGPPMSSANLKDRLASSVAAVAIKLTLAKDCPTQFLGPSANGKYLLGFLLIPANKYSAV